MRKLSRLLLFIVAACIAVMVVLLIGANLYVQSHGAQAKIQQELSHRLGTKLEIRQISVTPWGGLKLNGLTVPQDVPGATGNFLEAETFRLRLRLSSLFAKRLVVRDVALINPTVVWPQNEKGTWRLPGARAEEVTAATETGEASPTPPPVTELPSAPPVVASPTSSLAPAPIPVVSAPNEKEKSKLDFEPQIRRINMNNGTFRFLDHSGAAVSTFEGIDFRSTVDSPGALHGQARVAKVSLRDRFYLSDVQTPVRYDPAELTLSKIAAHAANGDLFGQFTLHPREAQSPFTMSVQFRNLQADQIVTEAGGPSGTVQGTLEGKFDAEGKSSDAEALTGTGEVVLRDGQLRQYSLLVALGQVLQIEELTQLHLDEAQAKYHVTPGVVTIDELILRSPNIRLSAKGTVGFNGKLRLDSQLALNEKVRNQLFKPVRKNFQPIEEPGYAAVDFQVTGTLDRPKSNLMEKVVGREIKDLGSVINSFLGKPDKKKKKGRGTGAEPNESPADSPAESAAPSSTP